MILLSGLRFHSATGADNPRSPVYPFDVTVSGEVAKLDGSIETAIFAKLNRSVKADALVELATDPSMIIVNVFRSDAEGVVSQADQAKAKVIMVQSGTKFGLDQTMDGTTLEPGSYAMNIVVPGLGTSRILFKVGDGTETTVAAESKEEAIDQSKPENVLQAVFDCAKSGKYALLRSLQSSTADGDIKRVCGVADAPEDEKAEFSQVFSQGKTTGVPQINGNEAAIDFLFGPDGTKAETMNLMNQDGKWFLDSF